MFRLVFVDGELQRPDLHRHKALTGVCLSVYLSVRMFVCLAVYLSVCLSLCLSVCLSVYLSLFVYLPVCLCVCLAMHLMILNYNIHTHADVFISNVLSFFFFNLFIPLLFFSFCFYLLNLYLF